MAIGVKDLGEASWRVASVVSEAALGDRAGDGSRESAWWLGVEEPTEMV